MKQPDSPAFDMGGSRTWIRSQGQRWGRSRSRIAINWGRYNPIRMQYLKERRQPQQLWLELLGKSYVGLIYWTALVDFLRNLFWFQLKAGGLAPQLGFLTYLFIPSVALGRRFFRQFLDTHPWSRALLVFGGVLGLLGQVQHSALRRLTLSACGVGLLGIYVWEGMWAETTARRERTAFGMVGGILLLQVLRWAYAGPNPLIARWWGFLFFVIVPGICSALLVLCEDLAESEGAELQSFIEEDEDIELEPLELDQDDGAACMEPWSLSHNHKVELVRNGSVELDRLRGTYTCVSTNPSDADDLKTIAGLGRESRDCGGQNGKWQDPGRASSSEGVATQKIERLGDEIVEGMKNNTIKEASIDDTFQELSWGFGDEAFREVKSEIGARNIEEEPPTNNNNGTIEGVQGDTSPMKKTRRAQLIEESVNNGEQSNRYLRSKSISSPKGIGSPMKNKRWGEGEEVPWLMDIKGDHDISESELDVYRHRDTKWNIGSCMRTAQMGIGSGSLLFLTHWILTAPTSFPRWLGRSSQFGWVSISSLIVGLVAATEYPRILCLRRTQGLVFWVLAVLGAALFMRSADGAIVGGALLAFSTPSLWISIAQCNLEKYPGGGLGIMVLVYVTFVVWSTSLVAYQFVPPLGFLRGTRGILLGCALSGIGLGVAREPGTASKERAAHGGIWRGLFTSEIDARGRQAVGALIGLVGVIAAVAFGVRLQHTPADKLPNDSLKVLNFNVQQGFSRSGTANHDAVLSILHEQQAHFVMLQETDMMHIDHGNLDMIDYWSTWLRMHSLYTPATKSDTWGCALLSYYPFIYSESGVLSSPQGENACYQYAQVQVAGKVVHLVNTHFGVSENEIVLQSQQLGAVVRRILNTPQEGKVWLLMGGDLNAAPLSLAYNTTLSSGLQDPHVSLHGEWKGPWERDPGAGYVFSSQGFNCTSWMEPQYNQQKTSDGNPIVASFQFPL